MIWQIVAITPIHCCRSQSWMEKKSMAKLLGQSCYTALMCLLEQVSKNTGHFQIGCSCCGQWLDCPPSKYCHFCYINSVWVSKRSHGSQKGSRGDKLLAVMTTVTSSCKNEIWIDFGIVFNVMNQISTLLIYWSLGIYKASEPILMMDLIFLTESCTEQQI